jgi:hypothetical protein
MGYCLTQMEAITVRERIEVRLAPLLGPNMARNATRTFSQSALLLQPEALTAADVPRLLAALRPALRTLLGAITTEQLLEEIAREFR